MTLQKLGRRERWQAVSAVSHVHCDDRDAFGITEGDRLLGGDRSAAHCDDAGSHLLGKGDRVLQAFRWTSRRHDDRVDADRRDSRHRGFGEQMPM
jgi:hypothetical protein